MVRSTPLLFVSLTEEVPRSVIDMLIDGLVCRREGAVEEVGRPTAQNALQPCSHFIPGALVAGLRDVLHVQRPSLGQVGRHRPGLAALLGAGLDSLVEGSVHRPIVGQVGRHRSGLAALPGAGLDVRVEGCDGADEARDRAPAEARQLQPGD